MRKITLVSILLAISGFILMNSGATIPGLLVSMIGLLTCLTNAGIFYAKARMSLSSVKINRNEIPLRNRTDLSSTDKSEVWMAIQTMQRHHGHSDLSGLISSKKLGKSLDADDCEVCGRPRFQRGLRWLSEVINR